MKKFMNNSQKIISEPEVFALSKTGKFLAECYRRLEFNKNGTTYAEMQEKKRTGLPYVMLKSISRGIKIDSPMDLTLILKSVLPGSKENNSGYPIVVYPDGGMKISDKNEYRSISIAKSDLNEFIDLLTKIMNLCVDKDLIQKIK